MAFDVTAAWHNYHAYTIALHGDAGPCAAAIHAFRRHEHLAEVGIAYRADAADFLQLVGRHRDVAAAVIVWSDGDADSLLELVTGVRRRQGNPLMPILVRHGAPLPDGVRASLKANGVHGPYCRQGQDDTALAEDLLFAIAAMHERQALVGLSQFAGDRAGIGSLPELGAAALGFLHRNGIGDLGGMFCFLRPTSVPDWVVVAGSGRFGAVDCQPLAGVDAGLRARIEAIGGVSGEHWDADSLLLSLVTPEGSRICLYLAQRSAPMPWHRVVAQMFANRLAIVVDELLLKRRLERMHHANIATLATLAEYKDVDTGNHVARVSRLTTEVAQMLVDRAIVGDEAAALVRQIGHASILHDVGKVGIPDRILLKPGKLDADERTVIESHTLLGHEILMKTAMISDGPGAMTLAATVARSHHERYDGKGYPDGLAGEAIPLAARIVAVVDVFDALTGERPYKQPWPEEKAVDFICEHAGQHFDPKVVEAFLAVLERRRSDLAAVWDDRFSVGHAGIDNDHRRLFHILNRIWTAKETGSRQVVEMALDDLMHYAGSHFAREEIYMDDHGYPERDSHQAAHRSFTERVEALRWEYMHGLRREIHAELLEFLSRWLMDHIATADRGYSRFIAALASAGDALSAADA